MLLLTAPTAQAQIKIGGNVYGGGNMGYTSGNTTVTVRAGNIDGKVFGGARMADVGGSAFVNIDGEHSSGYILINQVYGGNDIAGSIGTSEELPTELTKIKKTEADEADSWKNAIDNTWNAFVRVSSRQSVTTSETEGKKTTTAGVYIGELFGGGNGYYTYVAASGNNPHQILDAKTGQRIATSETSFTKPELAKTYLEIVGGSIVYAFGGGNNATVTNQTVICVDNPSQVVNSVMDNGVDLLQDINRIKAMDINPGFTFPTSASYQIGSFFGGNNLTPMAIRPTWNLKQGKIRNLYSGGNRGSMTSPEGLLLEIKEESEIEVGNVYGGCRMADVHPMNGDNEVNISQVQLNDPNYYFPAGLPARLLVRGGHVTNVYGGNDISGKVYGGNAVGVYTHIDGDIYGGGNGSYPYTDNALLANDQTYSDLYYNPDRILSDAGITGVADKLKSVTALNLFRPNAEAVSVRVHGKDADHPTIIGGSIYCGGNSATLSSTTSNHKAELKIGSHVIADNVYLGNNGENMVNYDPAQGEKLDGVLLTYSKYVGAEDNGTHELTNTGSDDKKFTTMNLKDPEVFEEYMKGAAMMVKPEVVFDNKLKGDPDTYVPYTSYFGSFFCGGNRGSVLIDGSYEINVAHEIIIFDKLVGGSNNAFIDAKPDFNAECNGGLIGEADSDGNKLILGLSGLKLQPKRWNADKTALVWNIISSSTGDPVDPVTSGDPTTSSPEDLDRRFTGGNIYGGCYNSGHVNGNVVINIDATIVDRDILFDEVKEDEDGEASLYQGNLLNQDAFTITKRRTGVILDQQGMDVLGKALNVFGGGYGEKSEIWGSTTVNLNKGYIFQIFGGGEMGAIGKKNANGNYTYDPKYSCYVNLKGEVGGVSKQRTLPENQSGKMAECEFIYGGGFFGTIAGNTVINLGNGRIFNSFAGSCNADILGHTETYMGRQVKEDFKNLLAKETTTGTIADSDDSYTGGFPWIRDIIYGGNDLGGEIIGSKDFTSRVNTATQSMVHPTDANNDGKKDVLQASAYVEYLQGRTDGIFGGHFGTYNYKDRKFAEYTDSEGEPINGFKKPHLDNAFVNIRPTVDNPGNVVKEVYGGTQGYPGETNRDKMQERSYVLIDIPQEMNKFQSMEVFGAGAWAGLGMTKQQSAVGTNKDAVSAIVDLVHGQIGSAYGASYKEGFTPRTVVNVPNGSTISLGYIFGGAYGENNSTVCDAYETHVNYHSAAATVSALYGGNNNCRRTLYGQVNVDVPVWSNREKGYMGTVYGAGYGQHTWSQYTEVNLNNGADIYEVYGGGENGHVMNQATVEKMFPANGQLNMGSYTDNGLEENALVKPTPLGGKHNTNVYINKGAHVINYAYGGGKGTGDDPEKGIVAIPKSGDVNGTTFIGLFGGSVEKDIYAAGTIGAVLDEYGTALPEEKRFTASTTAYVAGGAVRNVYGGGWKGDVGYTTMTISEDGTAATFDNANERPGVTNVIVGIRKDQASLPTDYGFYNGIPTIQRNVYSGGEGGAVFGTANLTINNGYIGYYYDNGVYKEKLDDETYTEGDGTNRLEDCGNAFGGGYDVRSSVDHTNVTMFGGVIRNSMHGGGEIATIGRGAITASGKANRDRTLKGFYLAGSTRIEMFNGHVHRNVFGGGKGYNLLGYGQGTEGTLFTDGYVFGQTEVHIHGGEVGTDETLKQGYGNVFGGGDIGYVYGKGVNSPKTIADKNAGKTTGSPGHYYYYDSEGKLTEDCKVVVSPYLQVKDANGIDINGHHHNQYDYVETEDLNHLPKKNAQGNFNGTDWTKLFTGANKNVAGATVDTEERGIHIHNAVFAGGNVSSNTDQPEAYADATTVYGNTSATLYDVFHRDFITVGTEHTGGLYGGGNLSMVDGYRELNITNYGTDYYGLKQTISIDEYRGLSNRERAYFQLEYKCIANGEVEGQNNPGVMINGKFYAYESKLTEEEYLKLVAANESLPEDERLNLAQLFEPYGFCSIYAGRLLNTIQRADFCGVFGSRMVLQGAKDRIADAEENVNYTINRVSELSLNQQRSKISSDTGKDFLHGNYFGIYSVVNYLGNLTSDVHFSDYMLDGDGNTVYYDANNNVVKTVEINGEDVDVSTLTPEERTANGVTTNSYYGYKSERPKSSDRNKGESFNEVALASGVFLELTTENSTKEAKDYGYVTGVIELDLINVKKDQVGGGFVYAKNEHRVPRRYPNKQNVILSQYNKLEDNEACTYKQFRYSTADGGDWEEDGAFTMGHSESDSGLHEFGEIKEWQTSGNFIHHEKRIVDDCYPTNNAYIIGSANYSPAHYWYVKGDVYIYEQTVSAYTGSATAYSKEVHLPLTITAASHGKLQLLNVKPNLYAYYTKNSNGDKVKIGEKDTDNTTVLDKVTVNNESDTYGLNDVISWWDWHQMSAADREYFVPQTYVNCYACKVDGVPYEAGTYVMLPSEYDTFNLPFTNEKGEPFKDNKDNVLGKDYVFRPSNNIGHDTGYLLTFDMSSPEVWDDYYSPVTGVSTLAARKKKKEYEALFTEGMTDAQRQAILDAWREGPTFTPTTTGVYGKRQYKIGTIVTEDTYTHAAEGKNKMQRAYVATETVTYDYLGQTKTMNPGAAISETEYGAIGSAQSSFAPALFCTNTVRLTKGNYLLYGELKTEDDVAAMKNLEGLEATAKEIDDALTPAYICIADGEYGGQSFAEGTNYSAIQAWCSLSQADRTKFNYNYDALDLLVDKNYLNVDPSVTTSPSHETTVSTFKSPYADQVDVEYQAVFKKNSVDVTLDGSSTPLENGAVITSAEFESLRNDKSHYTHVKTTKNGETVYIAANNFIYLGVPYGEGQVVDQDVYAANTGNVNPVVIQTAGDWYYCWEGYEKADGTKVPASTLISANDYKSEELVPNYQQYFVIQGKEPTETTTLYVSHESEIQDVMKEKIISVVYQYTYYENEDDGSVKMTNELHVINIKLMLESGVPQIGQLNPPATVLPGEAVGLRAPEVNPGLFEVLNNGWMLYSNKDDADNHRNGVDFYNGITPVYWYQNQKNYVAFYSETRGGLTYSNPVPLSVANYHDLDAVMKDKNHLFVDKSNVDRDCKIYIDNRICTSDETKSELDLLKDFFDLTVGSPLAGHNTLGSHIRAGRNLEFFLRSDVSPKKYTDWTPIGNNDTADDPNTPDVDEAIPDGQCFDGTLHGDGHTISGLNKSLFAHLCGDVYNLGVTGSFTGAGIADTGDGYVENCWVKSSAETVDNVKAVFGNPLRTDGTHQVENCYYPESNNYASGGAAHQMPDKDFYNGEVAYNLNGFYLNKRYFDNNKKDNSAWADYTQETSWGGIKKPYTYLDANAATTDGSLPETGTSGEYPDIYAQYQPKIKGEVQPYLGYVETRFYDGDFRYAGGTVPEAADIRRRVVTEGTGDNAKDVTYYYPIWPDDYIFFGQVLNYGHVGSNKHQDYPSAIKKSGERIVTGEDGNRVYRAPAYFRNGTQEKKDVAHFNPYAVFAQTKADDNTVIAYKNMTAIDFTGGNGDVAGGYQYGWEHGHFFHPLLDDDGLTGFHNEDLTQNLLVYTAEPDETTAHGKTGKVVQTYLTDDNETFPQSTDNYGSLPFRDASSIKGHWVKQVEGTDSYVSTLDHLLVDKQDFNCPISYTFTDGHRMWYQRIPDRYAGQKKDSEGNAVVDPSAGWEGISLPFTATLVTTNEKGELTHFYSDTDGSAIDEGRMGHEYWLREFTKITEETEEVEGNQVTVGKGTFTYPKSNSNDANKEVGNTFLWDYYYEATSGHNHLDYNKDTYQTYYNGTRTYQNYPLLAKGTPYIIGFPGQFYYEFDLSGQWKAETTDLPNPRKLDAQTITFASATGITIGVSDSNEETAGASFTTNDGKKTYTFKPSYLNEVVTEGGYVMDSDGDRYDRVTSETATNAKTVEAFRPYFTVKAANGARVTRSIVFSNELSQLRGEDRDAPTDEEIGGTLDIRAKKHLVVVESSLTETTEVRIVNTAGITVSTFAIEPGETVETRIFTPGVYIVQTTDGQYNKKLAVK